MSFSYFLSCFIPLICHPRSRKNEREKQALILERERQTSTARNFESSLHQMELNEKDLTNNLREKSALEDRVEQMKKEIVSLNNQLKVCLIMV